MRYQVDVTITDEQYLDYNLFTSFESKSAQKTVLKTRIIFTLCMTALLVVFNLVMEWDFFAAAYSVLLAGFTVLYVVFFKKAVKRNIKKNISRMKKSGKLPYDPQAKLEFYEDKLVEIAPDKRTEQSYSSMERVCVVPGRFILLYYNSIGAYIVPQSQAKAQLNMDDFLAFISQKCKNVEYYQK